MPNTVDIKFKNGGKVYYFDPNNLDLKEKDSVVVETSRGVEIAEVVSGIKERDEKQLIMPLSKVIRLATEKDFAVVKEQEKKRPQVKETADKLIKKYNLDMKIVDVEFTLDNSKTIISFLCEERVDFRELVKELATTLHQRIELRQIGVRDQAKIVGALGACGKECCCKQYLNDFDKVSIKMAKNQGLSLNPTKINGVCGRLMCCLAYENDVYEEANKKMPKLNSFVETPDGVGQVIYNNILKEMASVKVEKDGEFKIGDYKVEDLKFNVARPIREEGFDKNKREDDKKANEPRRFIRDKKEKISIDERLNQINHTEAKNNQEKINKDNEKNKTNEARELVSKNEIKISNESKKFNDNKVDNFNKNKNYNNQNHFGNKENTVGNNVHNQNSNNNSSMNNVGKINTAQFNSGVVIHADDDVEIVEKTQINKNNHYNKNRKFNGNRHFEKKN